MTQSVSRIPLLPDKDSVYPSWGRDVCHVTVDRRSLAGTRRDGRGGGGRWRCFVCLRRIKSSLAGRFALGRRRRSKKEGNQCRVIDEGNLSRNRETGQDEDEDGDGEDQEGAGWLALALIDAALLPGRRRGDGTMAWRRGFLSWAISPRVFGISG